MDDIYLLGQIALVISFFLLILGNALKTKALRKEHELYSNYNKKEDQELLALRQKTLSTLKKLRIKYNPALPLYTTKEECKKKSINEMLKKAFSISVMLEYLDIFLKAKTEEEKTKAKEGAKKKILKYELSSSLSPKEKEFLKNPDMEKALEISWSGEALLYLTFALGLIDAPPTPEVPHNFEPMVKVYLSKNSIDEVAQKAKEVSLETLLLWNDMFFNLQWACNDAKYKNKKVKHLNPDVVAEFFKASIWVISNEEEWDDIDLSA